MFLNGSKIPQNSQVPSLTQWRDPNRNTLPAILPFANPCKERRPETKQAPSESFLHNYPSPPWELEETCKHIPQGEVVLFSKTAWCGLNVNVRVEGQSDHHLPLCVWRVTSPVLESTRCPFSCWQPVPGWTWAKMFSLVENLQRLPLKQPFFLPHVKEQNDFEKKKHLCGMWKPLSLSTTLACIIIVCSLYYNFISYLTGRNYCDKRFEKVNKYTEIKIRFL